MILVFGSTGQVARELRAVAPDAKFLSREDADLSGPVACSETVLKSKPDAVIIAAAYTAVDRAEEERDLARVVNADAPGAIARASAELDIPVVHISTDYVFDGTGASPRSPEEDVSPINAYGATKEAGEKQVRDSGATYAILRTSWVFSPHGANFPKTMLKLSQSHERLNVVGDQIGGPTPARAIAEACLQIARALVQEPELAGTYHLSGAPDVSWADFARAIFAEAGKSVDVVDICTTDYPTPAARPLNSRLDCSDLARFGLERPFWRDHLKAVIDQAETK